MKKSPRGRSQESGLPARKHDFEINKNVFGTEEYEDHHDDFLGLMDNLEKEMEAHIEGTVYLPR